MKDKINRLRFARQSALALLGFSGLRVSASALTPQSKPLSDKFLSQLPGLLELSNVPGVAVAVIENGKISWSSQFGVKNAETKEPLTPETVFPVGSLGKPVFGYAALATGTKPDHDRRLLG